MFSCPPLFRGGVLWWLEFLGIRAFAEDRRLHGLRQYLRDFGKASAACTTAAGGVSISGFQARWFQDTPPHKAGEGGQDGRGQGRQVGHECRQGRFEGWQDAPWLGPGPSLLGPPRQTRVPYRGTCEDTRQRGHSVIQQEDFVSLPCAQLLALQLSSRSALTGGLPSCKIHDKKQTICMGFLQTRTLLNMAQQTRALQGLPWMTALEGSHRGPMARMDRGAAQGWEKDSLCRVADHLPLIDEDTDLEGCTKDTCGEALYSKSGAFCSVQSRQTGRVQSRNHLFLTA